MTDGEPGMDPRYDPRFQRGYDASRDGDATLPAVAPSAAASGAGAELRPDVEREAPAVQTAPGRPRSDAHDPVVEAEPRAPRELRVEPEHPTRPSDRADAGPDPEPGPDRSEAAALVRSWLIAGWAVTAGATAIGAWLLWSVNSDYSYYSGIADPSSEGLRILGWTLAPALVLAGMVGAVVVTAVAADRHDEPPPADADAGPTRFRRPVAWWALPAIAVVAVVSIAWAVGLAVEGNAAGSGITFTPSGNATEGQEARLNTMALGQVAQMLIGPIASAAVAALVAVAVLEVRRAGRPGRTGRG
ncbi:hypothetical protein [Agromyces sp. NPDC058064]|uniref:hypothetical protein n=1 Tax=Agromyces sp. NPDC058064 TaxID=3346322 RepID=UPI0036D96D7A